MACIGLLIQYRRSNGNQAGSRPTEFWEVRFRELDRSIQENHKLLNEIQWLLINRTRVFDEIKQALQNEGKALGEIAWSIQQMLRERQR